METEKTFRIFYSWQSDVIDIKKFINKSLNKVKREYKNINIVIDQATRELPGSPDIVYSICSKIEKSDMFIGDVSFVLSSDKRSSPNPNVLYEVGYATAFLGDSRVCIVMDAKHNIDKCPFDIAQRRITKFSTSEEKEFINNIKSSIDLIIKNKPPKNILKVDIKRQRDIETVNNIISKINFDDVFSSLSHLPDVLEMDIFDYFLPFEIYKNSPSSIFFYDEMFHTYLDNIYDCIYKIQTSLINDYDPCQGNRCNLRKSKTNDKRYNEIVKMRDDAQKIILDFHKFIHENYNEIDIKETNRRASELQRKLESEG